jgi:CheY-like chemotaxis protein
VELHQGRIEACSEGSGKGAVFTVWLPCITTVVNATGGVAAAVAGAVPERRGHRVLIVDDNEDAAQSIALLLQLSGHETKVVTESAKVIAASEEFKPQCAILDIGLPTIDGYQLARELRRRHARADLALIALTGYGQSEYRERAMAAGFDHHFVKPVDPERLEAAIRRGGAGESGATLGAG